MQPKTNIKHTKQI